MGLAISPIPLNTLGIVLNNAERCMCTILESSGGWRKALYSELTDPAIGTNDFLDGLAVGVVTEDNRLDPDG